MKKDAAIIKALCDINLHPEPELTQDQEEMLRLALDPEEKFLKDVKDLFTQNQTKNRK